MRNESIISLLFEMNNGKGNFFAAGSWDITKAASGELFPFNFATVF